LIAISLLGSTGSIGRQCLDLAARMPQRLRIVGLGAGRSLQELAAQARRFRPVAVACERPADQAELRRLIDDPTIEVGAGASGQELLASLPSADTVVAAVVGFAGLVGTLAAARAGKRIALANKESLVAAGGLLTGVVAQNGACLLPVDSEHAALHQCLVGEDPESVERLWLTASGGPFRACSRAELTQVSVAAALDHPNWSMGPKVTVDSATMMNKGLELIEAAWLFNVDPDRIAIAVHPTSVVHSMVEFVDGTFKAQLGAPDMRAAIAYALSAPARLPLLGCEGVARWNPLAAPLRFESYDQDLFCAPDLCREALRLGGGAPAALNAINEVLVARFLASELSFLAISEHLSRGVDALVTAALGAADLDAVIAADGWGRRWASAA
jgi:1-deoxy-D-xylulose-5-phosphate reductoisomerase